MSLTLEILAQDEVSGILSLLSEGLTDRTLLNGKIAQDELAMIQEHLNIIANDRHATADELGAERSGFWANPGGYTSETSDDQRATVSVHHAGITRARHDVTIEPGPGKQWLTLPLLAAAYNQRAAGLDHLFVLRSKEGALFLARHEDQGAESGLEVLYLLVRSVTLPQDETLLPPDEAFLQTALQAAEEYVDKVIALREAA